MSIEVMFVAIAGMGCFILMISIVSKAETEKARATAAGAANSDAVKLVLDENAAEIARLRARVEVLERLATDEDRKLAGEIDRLRADQRTRA